MTTHDARQWRDQIRAMNKAVTDADEAEQQARKQHVAARKAAREARLRLAAFLEADLRAEREGPGLFDVDVWGGQSLTAEDERDEALAGELAAPSRGPDRDRLAGRPLPVLAKPIGTPVAEGWAT